VTDTCEKCGAVLVVGSYPFCPHGTGVSAVEPDDVPGGFVVENGFDQPTRFYSRSAHRKALEARGMELRPKWAGPNDKHLKRMDVPCAQTLENAKILLTRGTRTRDQAPDPRTEFPITVTNLNETFRYKVEA
jgi:hypothetical protein